MSEVLVVVTLALRACTGPVCCWEVRLDDGTPVVVELGAQSEQGPEARFEIPRQGSYFEARAAEGTCSDPGVVWSDWTRFAWLHPTDLDGNGVVGNVKDLVLFKGQFREMGPVPRASEYSYCLPAEPAEP